MKIKVILNFIIIPFVIVKIRLIQKKYKKLTVKNYYNQTTPIVNKLILLQSKEYYYKQQFTSWGKYNPKFSYSNKQLKSHKKFMKWLFPKKDFKEHSLVIWHNPEAITYYHNIIWRLSKGKPPLYEISILKQLEDWEKRI